MTYLSDSGKASDVSGPDPLTTVLAMQAETVNTIKMNTWFMIRYLIYYQIYTVKHSQTLRLSRQLSIFLMTLFCIT